MKTKILLFSFLTFLFLGNFVQAQETNSVNLYFFYSKTCPHCHDEIAYLTELKKEYQDKINIYAFEITENYGNAQLYKKFGEKFKVSTNNIPNIFVGTQNIEGYYNDEYTGTQIKNLIDQYLSTTYSDIGYKILYPNSEKEITEDIQQEMKVDLEALKNFKVPLFGKVDLGKTSLFLSTIILGGLDGFNPCAMWVLIFLISLLLGVQSTRRRWILGLTFIIGSGLVYFLFLTAWLKIFLSVGELVLVRMIIGILAISFGVYNLKKYLKNKAEICEITQDKSRQKTLNKLKEIALNKNLFFAIIGILAVAFSVNLIELACSAGFPAIYTKILSMHNFSFLGYNLYLLFYIFIFMLDDIVVFLIAMFTLKITNIDSKYSKYSNLIGGIIILILGVLLILKPGWLMFG